MKRTFTSYPSNYVRANSNPYREITVGEAIEMLSQYDPNLPLVVQAQAGFTVKQTRCLNGFDDQGNQKFYDYVVINGI